MKPPQAGFPMSRCCNRSYAASARLLLAVVIFPRDLPGLRDLGTQPQLHRPRRSQVAPVGLVRNVVPLTRRSTTSGRANVREVTKGMPQFTMTWTILRKHNFC